MSKITELTRFVFMVTFFLKQKSKNIVKALIYIGFLMIVNKIKNFTELVVM